MIVEWDESKNRENVRKHGISFQQAQELLISGSDYLEFFDSSHSFEEDRFAAVGPTSEGILLVVWTEREEGAFRIISARRATGSERELYHSYMEGRR